MTENNTPARMTAIDGLVELLKYFGNTDYKETIKEYKASNNPKRKKRNVPSDQKITKVYQTGFAPTSSVSKRYLHIYPQWQFLFGLLATYGLRIHEAWNIANWDKPVTLKNGDWVTVDIDNETEKSKQVSEKELVIPAILDSSNKEHILCIKHATKTGYRMAFPLSPEGHNWIEEFNLLQSLNLPDVKDPLKRSESGGTSYKCAYATCRWFNRRGYGFTAHDLRHAYNHRGHRLGLNLDALCQSLGHSYEMNTTTYRNSKSDEVKFQDMLGAMTKEQNKRSENELLKEENKTLKSQLEALQAENELLKTKLQLNKTIQES